MVITRNNKQAKNHHNTDVEMADDETIEATNGPTRRRSFNCVSFLQLRAEVSASKKGTATMKSKFQEIYKILLDADKTTCLSIYQTDPILDDNNKYTIEPSKIITSPNSIPDSITAMSKYFFGCRPNSEGGTIWSQIRLLHSDPIENIIADTRGDLEELNSGLSLQAIQHWDVAAIGFLKNLHPDVDGVCLQEYFTAAIQKIHPSCDVMLGLKVKSPYDGTRRDPNRKVKFKDRIHAFHVDTIGEQRDIIIAALKTILSSEDFKHRYTTPVRLIPLYDRRSSPYTQEKVKRCILQHNQFCQSVTSLPVEGIPHLDHVIRSLKGTFRQLILSIPDSHFINIDQNWSKTSYYIIFPRKYETEATNKIAHIAAYLHREFGDKILSSLPPAAQQTIHDTTWDEDGKPSSKIDRELDDIIDEDNALDFVDTAYFTKVAASSSSSVSQTFTPKLSDGAPVAFIPEVDDCSVSTFGTNMSKSPLSNKISHSSRDKSTDNVSIYSGTSMSSRVSKVETDMGEMKSMLRQLVDAQCKASTAPTQRSCSSKAGQSDGCSAGGG